MRTLKPLTHEILLSQIDLPMIFSVALIIIVTLVAYHVISKLVSTTARRVKVQPDKVNAITNIVKIACGGLGFISILGAIKIDVTGVIAGVGIGALAIGFAAQALISNLISGLFLFFEGVINFGDYVQIGEVIGKVVKMSFRTTQLETIDGNVVTFPNSLLATTQIINLTNGKPEVLLTIQETIDIYTDTTRAKALMIDAVKDVEGVVIDSTHQPTILVDRNPMQWSTVLTLYVTATSTDWHIVQSNIKERIKKKFEAAGIIPPIPAIARGRIEDIKKELDIN
jgi:small conductance mechanosensitive channel